MCQFVERMAYNAPAHMLVCVYASDVRAQIRLLYGLILISGWIIESITFLVMRLRVFGVCACAKCIGNKGFGSGFEPEYFGGLCAHTFAQHHRGHVMCHARRCGCCGFVCVGLCVDFSHPYMLISTNNRAAYYRRTIAARARTHQLCAHSIRYMRCDVHIYQQYTSKQELTCCVFLCVCLCVCMRGGALCPLGGGAFI